tara:strand:- start:6515 stop:7381 length:867 start_codon:yes stop_codon:yes gene_type:complete
MQLQINDLIDRHKDKPCVVTAHGPSLNLNKERIIEAHRKNRILRFSVNNWWDYFNQPPDYWVLSTGVFTIERMAPIINKYNIPTFFSDDADFTLKEFIKQNIKSDWLVYDQRHWKGKKCLEIIMDFKKHFEVHKNFDFLQYGNNKAMWQPPRHRGHFGHCITNTKCCDQNNPLRKTLQETLQELSKCDQHYSTGDSVTLHAIAFAIIMGCNPIYISGLDLDYNKGYANQDKSDWQQKAKGPNAFTPVRENFYNDLNVLSTSAKLRNINIVNLNSDSWYDSFSFGELEI